MHFFSTATTKLTDRNCRAHGAFLAQPTKYPPCTGRSSPIRRAVYALSLSSPHRALKR
jgi:hypothetical protein